MRASHTPKAVDDEIEQHREFRGLENSETGQAQRIVRDLYFRYEKQLQRWRDYRTLFCFLFFVGWYLATLYLQRSANTAYMVHSTLDEVLYPGSNYMQSTADVHKWLGNTLEAVWVDPVCGDGVCETPWEFASYSTFGCRADCGRLQEVQNLTTIQIDLKWNFGHPLGSTPASDLMRNAKWNLCPRATQFVSACYYETDQTFSLLSGSLSKVIEDAPDGMWTLNVKNDIFDKVSGAVRSTALVNNAAYWVKVYIAGASALAEMDMEERLLRDAVALGNTSLFDFVAAELASNATLNANFTVNAADTPVTNAADQVQQMKNATCACTGVLDAAGAYYDERAFSALNLTVDPVYYDSRPGTLVPGLFNLSDGWGNANTTLTYLANHCPTLAGSASPDLYDWHPTTTVTVNGPVTTWAWQPSTNLTATCINVLGAAATWRDTLMRRSQNLTIDWRLGDGTRTGKISARNAVFQQLQAYVIANATELFTPVFSAPFGTSVSGDAALNARLDVLQRYYALSPLFATSPQPMNALIKRSTVYAADVTALGIKTIAELRLQELRTLRDATLDDILVPTPDAGRYSARSLGTVVQQFLAAGATSPLAWNGTSRVLLLPDMNSTALGDLRTEYNLVKWAGNTTGYLKCDLEKRGPEYLGTCTPQAVTCAASGSDTAPWECTDGTSSALFPATSPYNTSSVAYRSQCELPCERALDCNTLCECWGNCLATEYCLCDKCASLNYDAREDPTFVDIRTSTGLSDAAFAAAIAPVPASAVPASGRRRLAQSNADILAEIQKVSAQQSTLRTQTETLQAKVDQANEFARARANDDTLTNLISQGRQDISNNQALIISKLDTIIGKQNQSLAAAAEASAAIASIQNLASQQAAAQQALATALQSQVTAIKSAAAPPSSIISITQALALWRKARRDAASTEKAAVLATAVCQLSPVTANNFTLDNGLPLINKTPRERFVGLTNRVVAGLLVYQTRTNETNCTDSKFNRIQQTCKGPRTIKSFGVDPVFKRGTSLYLPDFDDVNRSIVTEIYNCSKLATGSFVPTYNVEVLNQTVNPYPYCAELYNPQSEPYPFYYFPLEGKDPGFPAYFDINLGAVAAQKWHAYLEEGLFIDQHTDTLTAEMITYNAPLRVFGFFRATFQFTDGGSIRVNQRLDTVRIEMYNGSDDNVRLFLEIVTNLMVYGMLLWTFWKIVQAQREQHNALRFFLKAWNVLEFISNGLLASCCIIWWVYVQYYATPFTINLRYDVYRAMEPAANYLALTNNGDGLTSAWRAFSDMDAAVNLLNWYFALNGINILMLIARVLKLMDFQPRLGVVTRSLWLAGPDLIHFAIVAGMVFVGYAMMGHLIFGNVISDFATFGDSVNTCFEILLGNIEVNTQLRALDGLQGVAGALWFWTYELLVFMVLLNFLLAIIVDAFSEVKEKTEETVGVHTELFMMARDKWRSLMGMCSSNYISDAKLGTLLKQWAGEDVVPVHQERETVKLLTVLNEDMDEEDLKTVLLECLKDAPGSTDDDEKAAASSGAGQLVRRVFCLPSGQRVMATPREIELAAKYIVSRFGIKVEQGGDDSNNAAADGDSAVKAVGGDDGNVAAGSSAAGAEERGQLASALERLAHVQRELADGQRNLMSGQKQLAEQQSKLIALMSNDS